MGLLSGFSIENQNVHLNRAVYYNGDTVDGTVSFTLSNAVPVRGLYIEWKGSERNWSKQLNVSGSDHHTEYSDAKHNYFLVRQWIVQSSTQSEPTALLAGEYQIPISFTLPAVLPPSWAPDVINGSCEIKYVVRMVLEVANAPDSTIEQTFRVGTRVPRRQLETIYEPTTGGDGTPLGRLSNERAEKVDGRSGCFSCFMNKDDHEAEVSCKITIKSCFAVLEPTLRGGDSNSFFVSVELHNRKGKQDVTAVDVQLSQHGFVVSKLHVATVAPTVVRVVQVPVLVKAGGGRNSIDVELPVGGAPLPDKLAATGVFNSPYAGNDWSLSVYLAMNGKRSKYGTVGLPVYVFDCVAEKDAPEYQQNALVALQHRHSEVPPPSADNPVVLPYAKPNGTQVRVPAAMRFAFLTQQPVNQSDQI